MNFSWHKYAFALLFLAALSGAVALNAQQSSSSTVQASTPARPAPVVATPLRKWFIEGAGGGSFGPGLADGKMINPTYTGTGGGGFRLSRRLEIPGELSYYRSVLPSWVLQTAQQPGGHYTILTYSVDPTFYFSRGTRFGFFAVGGGGFSYVGTTFDKPIGTTINCSIYSGLGYANFTNFCNGTITGSSYSSNQAMYNFGIGMEGRLYPNHREILFAQGRYIHMMTPANQLPGPGFALVSITGGLRW